VAPAARGDSGLVRLLETRVAGRGAAAIAVAEGGPPELRVAWVPHPGSEEPAFLAYSVTKTFLAVVALRLQEKGRLDLDAPLSRWRPGVPAAERIRLRQLLAHTAGVPDYGALPAYHEAVRASPSEPWSPGRFAAETWGRGLLFEPGTGWDYSNPGYRLLREVLEEVEGTDLAALVTRHVAAPLGLSRTFAVRSTADLAPLAPGPSRLLAEAGSVRDAREAYHPGWVFHGVLASTASDLARFFAALFGGVLLSPASLAAMTHPVDVPAHRAPDAWGRPVYGLGLMGDLASPWGVLWGHNGGGPGYEASAFHAPDLAGRAVTVCALCGIEGEAAAEAVMREGLSWASAAKG